MFPQFMTKLYFCQPVKPGQLLGKTKFCRFTDWIHLYQGQSGFDQAAVGVGYRGQACELDLKPVESLTKDNKVISVYSL
jgi:hypothetical protein